MYTNPEDIDLIERYLKGQLSQAEAVDFETRLGEDHEFARKLRLRKTFPSLFKAEGNDAISMDIKKDPKECLPGKKALRKKRRLFIWLTIVILVLATAGVAVVRFVIPAYLSEDQSAVTAKSIDNTSTGTKAAEMKSAINKPSETKPGSLQPSAVQDTAKDTTHSRAAKTPPVVTLTTRKPVELLLPADNEVVSRGQDVLFSWKQETDSFTYFYLIYAANNKLACWRGIKPGIREITLPAIKYKAGKLYWYVGRKEYSRTLVIME